MTETPETKFKNKVRKYLKDKKIWFIKYFANMFTQSGIPDILGILPNGRFFALELKVLNLHGKFESFERSSRLKPKNREMVS